MNLIAQQQLVSHIAAWAAIPAALTVNSPITYANGGGLSVSDRISQFAAEVRGHEGLLLKALSVDQGHVDRFLDKSDQYRLLLWQLPQPWVLTDRPRANLVMTDMESLGLSLRRLEKTVAGLNAANADNPEDHTPVTIGREIHYLRRLIASRAALAEEMLPLVADEPSEAVAIFYEDGIRYMRRLDPLADSLALYHDRRPSWRPEPA